MILFNLFSHCMSEHTPWPPRPPREEAELYAMDSLWKATQLWLLENLRKENGKTRIPMITEKDIVMGSMSVGLDVDESIKDFSLSVFIQYHIDFRKRLKDVCPFSGEINIDIPVDTGHSIINTHQMADRIILADKLAGEFILDQNEMMDDADEHDEEFDAQLFGIEEGEIDDLPELIEIHKQIRAGTLPVQRNGHNTRT